MSDHSQQPALSPSEEEFLNEFNEAQAFESNSLTNKIGNLLLKFKTEFGTTDRVLDLLVENIET